MVDCVVGITVECILIVIGLFLHLFQALWENKFYYLFGFLFLVFIILIVSVSQIAIVMVYFQLCREVRRVVDDGVAVCYSFSFFINGVLVILFICLSAFL